MSAAPQSATVLIVDDVASNVLVLEALLGREYDVLVAMLGEDALKLAAERRPDLILLDVRLPDIDGYEVCRRLKGDPATRAIPVIFCSALGEVEDERRGFEAGGVDYLTKPVSEPLARARVATHLALARTSRQLDARVREQTAELARLDRLRSFFPPRLAEAIVAGGGADALATHRREITLARLELRGFTELSEAAEPEEVMDFLREYHALLGRTLERHDGILERFAGDTAVVIFNDPVPNEAHAAQALEAALALRGGFEPLAARWRRRGAALGLAAGIATGYATLGAIGFEGRWDYGVVGRVANLAIRLAGAAEAGRILVDQRAMARIGGRKDARTVGPLEFAGFAAPVSAFAL